MTASRRRIYLGMANGDLVDKPYAAFWNPDMAPLPPHAVQAVAHGPVAPPLLPPVSSAPKLLDSGHGELENGFCLLPDGAMHVAIRTEMPDVSPEMVDWWFGWHSAEPQRYKLWHPRAHVHAEWRGDDPPGYSGRNRYVGRTSCVDEYVGSELGRYAIQFIPPATLGLDTPSIIEGHDETAICARIGFGDQPADMGYLVHHVRRIPGGSEMRSRFWVGGPNAAGRRGSLVGGLAVPVAKLVMKPTASNGHQLLVHCSQEMSHLASFLPRLHAELRELH